VSSVTSSSDPKDPLALAAEWVGRIIAVGFEMVLPGLGGKWLDDRWGSGPVFTLIGFGLGMTFGIWHLLIMTSAKQRDRSSPNEKRRDGE
jgi:hypothetical protein